MKLGALSFDALLREFREYEFKRILTGIGDGERLLHVGLSYCKCAAIYCRRIDNQLGGLGGYTLHHDVGFIALIIGESDGSGVSTCLGRSIGEVEFHLSACREAGLNHLWSAKVRQRRCYVFLAVQTRRQRRTCKAAISAVEHLYLYCLALAHQQRTEVHYLGNYYFRQIACHLIGNRQQMLGVAVALV